MINPNNIGFVGLTKDRITTPNEGDVVYLNRYWSVDPDIGFMFWIDYNHPQCNNDKRVVEQLNKKRPERTIEFLAVAYVPLEWNKLESKW
jgi:hypothetical protein